MIRRIATAIIAVVLVFAPAASAQVPGANPVFFPSTQSIGSCTSSTGGNYLYFIPGHIIHEFTSSGTYTPSSSCTATYLMIGGGGMLSFGHAAFFGSAAYIAAQAEAGVSTAAYVPSPMVLRARGLVVVPAGR